MIYSEILKQTVSCGHAALVEGCTLFGLAVFSLNGDRNRVMGNHLATVEYDVGLLKKAKFRQTSHSTWPFIFLLLYTPPKPPRNVSTLHSVPCGHITSSAPADERAGNR